MTSLEVVSGGLGLTAGGSRWVAVAVILLVVLQLVRLLRSGRGPRPEPGDIWFAEVPFEDGTGSKDRPVLVLSASGRVCTVARCTSQDKGARRDHVRLPDGVPGLARVSWVSLRPQRLRRSALRRRVGQPGRGLVLWFEQVSGSAASDPTTP